MQHLSKITQYRINQALDAAGMDTSRDHIDGARALLRVLLDLKDLGEHVVLPLELLVSQEPQEREYENEFDAGEAEEEQDEDTPYDPREHGESDEYF